jgi:iron complex transport system substrate-binding protein
MSGFFTRDRIFDRGHCDTAWIKRQFLYRMAQKCITAWLLLLVAIFYTSPLQGDGAPPQRIITLSPHLAELVVTLGAGDQLLGVVEHSDFPQQVKMIPRVGGAVGLDLERILSIKPDLILAWHGGTRETDIVRLKQLGLRVVSIKSETLEDIPASIEIIGLLLNQQQRATGLIEEFNTRVKQILENNRKQGSHRVFIEISSQPLMGLTNRHPFAAGLELCGLINIFSEQDKAAIITDIESVFSRNTEYVLLRQHATSNDKLARRNFYQINDDRNIVFITFDEDIAFRQTPRLLDAVIDVCNTVNASN